MDNKKQDSELVPLSNAVVIVYRAGDGRGHRAGG